MDYDVVIRVVLHAAFWEAGDGVVSIPGLAQFGIRAWALRGWLNIRIILLIRESDRFFIASSTQ